MSLQKAGEAPLWQPLGTVAALAILFLGGPIASLILWSWWPVFGGVMIMVAWFLLIITVNLIREHRRPPTFGEAVVGAMFSGPVSSEVLRVMLAKAEAREAKERGKS